ncbi:uncharacterized protein BDR25DRAFT_312534 [Lindgomyces ingoldianus]|uniref:Uncharacterized protein n=1 Tax=Lindgomyces ingoldianus TaxID=673940 RepID=A0ACB6R2H2_9PLEO|nr:uncharacterized protein BDR25DRAFT_312534 [Lindgomyces ingoldianus]KAF2473478.1 hypothetical protein BDR25DRAFT_312534 [Lindgomyces ingoldianus]
MAPELRVWDSELSGPAIAQQYATPDTENRDMHSPIDCSQSLITGITKKTLNQTSIHISPRIPIPTSIFLKTPALTTFLKGLSPKTRSRLCCTNPQQPSQNKEDPFLIAGWNAGSARRAMSPMTVCERTMDEDFCRGDMWEPTLEGEDMGEWGTGVGNGGEELEGHNNWDRDGDGEAGMESLDREHVSEAKPLEAKTMTLT